MVLFPNRARRVRPVILVPVMGGALHVIAASNVKLHAAYSFHRRRRRAVDHVDRVRESSSRVLTAAEQEP